jgi:hypothetical protein
MSSSYVADDLRSREDDVIWRISQMGARLAVCLSASRVSIDGGSVHGSADLELCGLALPRFDPQRAAHGFWPATPGVAAGIVQWRQALAGP